MKDILVVLVVFWLGACISKSRYNQLEQENKKVVEETKNLNKQLNKLKSHRKLLLDSTEKLQFASATYRRELLLAKYRLVENLEKMIKETDIKYAELHTALGFIHFYWEEKNVFYYLNLARNKPKYFAQTYLSKNKSYQKLHDFLMKATPVAPVSPSYELYLAALCRASTESEQVDFDVEKHCKNLPSDRQFFIVYDTNEALEIVLQLLTSDAKDAYLSPKTKFLGVIIRPHTSRKHVTALSYLE